MAKLTEKAEPNESGLGPLTDSMGRLSGAVNTRARAEMGRGHQGRLVVGVVVESAGSITQVILSKFAAKVLRDELTRIGRELEELEKQFDG